MARETALAQDSASLAFRARRLVIALGAFLSLASSPVLAQSPAAQRGLTFVRVCHAIDKVSGSPLAIAPPFRTLHLTYHLICPSFGNRSAANAQSVVAFGQYFCQAGSDGFFASACSHRRLLPQTVHTR